MVEGDKGRGDSGKGVLMGSLHVPITRSLEQFPKALGRSPNHLSILEGPLRCFPHSAAGGVVVVWQRGVGKGHPGWVQRRGGRGGREEKEEQEEEQKEKHEVPAHR